MQHVTTSTWILHSLNKGLYGPEMNNKSSGQPSKAGHLNTPTVERAAQGVPGYCLCQRSNENLERSHMLNDMLKELKALLPTSRAVASQIRVIHACKQRKGIENQLHRQDHKIATSDRRGRNNESRVFWIISRSWDYRPSELLLNTPQHNGVSERETEPYVTNLDMVRSMMSQTTLPKSFWDYALETAARILNMVPTKKVEKTVHNEAHKDTKSPQIACVLYIGAEEQDYECGNAIHEKTNEVWILVELPPNGKTVGSKWLFKKKTDMDGAVHTYKARLVAKGYTQTPGI
ncbi:retrotransposon protein, putative, ty1-copia subclass [Tanacetum coccineum]